MPAATITCHFCFEPFEVYLEAAGEDSAVIEEIYDCVVCCHPNRLTFRIEAGEAVVLSVDDGNQ